MRKICKPDRKGFSRLEFIIVIIIGFILLLLVCIAMGNALNNAREFTQGMM